MKIVNLTPVAGALDGSEQIPANKAGTKRITAAQIAALGQAVGMEGASVLAIVWATIDAQGDELIKHNSGIAGIGNASLRELLLGTAVAPEHALAAGENIAVDAGPAIRRILAAGRTLLLSRNKTYIVRHDPASNFDDGGVTRFSRCIAIPSNATIIGEAGSKIKGADGLQSWTRIVTFEGVTGWQILGKMIVDGNVENKGEAHNEHMHGAFFFNAKGYIEALECRSTRGDNKYVGGTDNSQGTANLFIGRFIGRKAGRKNIACQAFDALHIGSADLDNTEGGIGAYMPPPQVGQSIQRSSGVYASDTGFPMLNTTGAAIVLTGTTQASLSSQGFVVDTTDKHCLDLEPDSWTGAVRNHMRIDYVRARGSGVDFTAGTTFTQANAMMANIGELDMVVVPSPGVPVWIQNAITVDIGILTINGITATCPTSTIYYGARLKVGKWTVNGASPVGGYAFLISQVGNNVPRVEVGTLDGAVTGNAFEVRDADFEVTNNRLTASGVTIWARGLSSVAGVETRVSFKRWELDNSGDPLGANYAALHTKSGGNTCRLDLPHIVYRDSRATKLARIVYCQSGAAAGLSIGRVDNETIVPTVEWQGADKYYRMTGGGMGPAQFVCQGTPEGMIPAHKGSMAFQMDAAAHPASAAFVKKSSPGPTDWYGL